MCRDRGRAAGPSRSAPAASPTLGQAGTRPGHCAAARPVGAGSPGRAPMGGGGRPGRSAPARPFKCRSARASAERAERDGSCAAGAADRCVPQGHSPAARGGRGAPGRGRPAALRSAALRSAPRRAVCASGGRAAAQRRRSAAPAARRGEGGSGIPGRSRRIREWERRCPRQPCAEPCRGLEPWPST